MAGFKLLYGSFGYYFYKSKPIGYWYKISYKSVINWRPITNTCGVGQFFGRDRYLHALHNRFANLPTLVDWLTPHTNTHSVSECMWNFENICHVKFVPVGDFLASLLLFYCKSKTIKSSTIFMCVSNFFKIVSHLTAFHHTLRRLISHLGILGNSQLEGTYLESEFFN